MALVENTLSGESAHVSPGHSRWWAVLLTEEDVYYLGVVSMVKISPRMRVSY